MSWWAMERFFQIFLNVTTLWLADIALWEILWNSAHYAKIYRVWPHLEIFIDLPYFDFDSLNQNTMHLSKPQKTTHHAAVKIEPDVWIGAHAMIYEDVTVGSGSMIGGGAVITKDVSPYSIVVWNNRVIRQRFSDEVISDLFESKWWDYNFLRMQEPRIRLPYEHPEQLLSFLNDLDPEQKSKAPDESFVISGHDDNKILTDVNL